MRIALAKIGARGLGAGIGWISLSLGLALTLAPRKTAGFLGWRDRERLARAIGVADLVVGTGLLVSARPSRWMLARTLLNVVIGGAYAGILAAGAPERRRAIGGVCLMGALTANDYFLSRCLWEIEASYNPTNPGPERREQLSAKE
ncbi:MAG TPA: hypothetical protein VHM16_05740 [Rubrobacteraceae bacterium]|nr:hypothetical protein [Rubrobacteraceae bacterium]